ncbi:MAG: hypothetical protein ACI4IJ_04390, partial [Acutalibacteraceae bacterium]
ECAQKRGIFLRYAVDFSQEYWRISRKIGKIPLEKNRFCVRCTFLKQALNLNKFYVAIDALI